MREPTPVTTHKISDQSRESEIRDRNGRRVGTLLAGSDAGPWSVIVKAGRRTSGGHATRSDALAAAGFWLLESPAEEADRTTRRLARQANRRAKYTRPDADAGPRATSDDGGTVTYPLLTVAGTGVFVYVDSDGVVTVSIDFEGDDGIPDWLLRDDETVPVRVMVNGERVFDDSDAARLERAPLVEVGVTARFRIKGVSADEAAAYLDRNIYSVDELAVPLESIPGARIEGLDISSATADLVEEDDEDGHAVEVSGTISLRVPAATPAAAAALVADKFTTAEIGHAVNEAVYLSVVGCNTRECHVNGEYYSNRD